MSTRYATRPTPCFRMLHVPLVRIGDRDYEVERLDEIVNLHRLADAAITTAKCYFIGGPEGPIKIGYSIDVPARLAALQFATPVPLLLYATALGEALREAAYHAEFAKYRVRGEWFERSPELMATIRSCVRATRRRARKGRLQRLRSERA